MIGPLELATAVACVTLSIYVLMDGIVPLYLLAFVAVGVVAGLIVLPYWHDRR
jgi:hypothetical protein